VLVVEPCMVDNLPVAAPSSHRTFLVVSMQRVHRPTASGSPTVLAAITPPGMQTLAAFNEEPA
jgi:hypothetical protein